MENSRSTKVALFDNCHTLVRVTTITDFTDNFLLNPLQNPYVSLRRRVWHGLVKFLRYRLGLVDSETYRAHLIRLFRGYTPELLVELSFKYAAHLEKLLKPELFQRLEALRDEGYEVFLVTAGLDVYLVPFADRLGIELVATTLEKGVDGTYTGRIDGPDCVGEGKVAKVRVALARYESVDWEDSHAFGDTVSDIPILSLVGHPHVVDPNNSFKAYADAHGWEVLRTKTSMTC